MFNDAFFFPKELGASIFNKHNDILSGIVPYIHCVTRIQRTDALTAKDGCIYKFTVHFAQIKVEFSFEDERAAVVARRDLIFQMVDVFGPDQIVFTNGFYSEVAVVSAILELTPIHVKDSRAGFTAIMTDMTEPLFFICLNYHTAADLYQKLNSKIEACRRSVLIPMELQVA